MSWHEMACDAGYGPNDHGHAEMEAMAEAQDRHEFEMRCEAEAALQAQAEAAQAEAEAAQYNPQRPHGATCGDCRAYPCGSAMCGKNDCACSFFR